MKNFVVLDTYAVLERIVVHEQKVVCVCLV